MELTEVAVRLRTVRRACEAARRASNEGRLGRALQYMEHAAYNLRDVSEGADERAAVAAKVGEHRRRIEETISSITGGIELRLRRAERLAILVEDL